MNKSPLAATYRGLALPFVVIAAGLVLLLANLGVITWNQAGRLWLLLPLVLILLGGELLLRSVAAPPTARPLAAGLAILLLVAGLTYVAAGPGPKPGPTSNTAGAPLGSATTGTLEIDGGTLSVTATTKPLGDQLYTATLQYPSGSRPNVVAGDGSVRISFDAHGFDGFLFGRQSLPKRAVVIQLNDQVLWQISVAGGAIDVHADVRSGRLRSLSIEGGASRLEASLPPPAGTVPITMQGGALTAVLHRPAGVEAQVLVAGGAGAIDADGHHLGALGGELSWSTAGWAAASDRYGIRAEGGANHISLDTT